LKEVEEEAVADAVAKADELKKEEERKKME
jgi:hypothetical protein